MAENTGSVVYQNFTKSKLVIPSAPEQFTSLTDKIIKRMSTGTDLSDSDKRYVYSKKDEFDTYFKKVHETYKTLEASGIKISDTTNIYLRHIAWLKYKHDCLREETNEDVNTSSDFSNTVKRLLSRVGPTDAIAAANEIIKTTYGRAVEEKVKEEIKLEAKKMIRVSSIVLDSEQFYLKFTFASLAFEQTKEKLENVKREEETKTVRKEPQVSFLIKILDQNLMETVAAEKALATTELKQGKIFTDVFKSPDKNKPNYYTDEANEHVASALIDVARFTNERSALVSSLITNEQLHSELQKLLSVLAIQQYTKEQKEDINKKLQKNFKDYLVRLDEEIKSTKEFENQLRKKEQEVANITLEIFNEYFST